jgi:hypothetical protein
VAERLSSELVWERRVDEPSGPGQTETLAAPPLSLCVRTRFDKKRDAVLVSFVEPFLASFEFKHPTAKL